MRVSPGIRVMVSWIASFAILLSALAPVISHAVQADVPAGWAEICSVTGAKLVRLSDMGSDLSDGSQPESSQGHTYKHCPFCAMHSDDLAPPPAPVCELQLPELGQTVPTLFLQAPRTLFAWASAQPRAPPLNS
ncbi:DUF2946 domain-containing protein [Roseateles sp.]|uniref:DUF2946 domain-containing protein n=1 Tax=Roseateles sp. TaxID=1971397 RepID=UPI003D0FD5D4